MSQKIAVSGLFAALICVFTLLHIPIPGGSGIVHLGDAIIFIACFFLSARYSAITAAAGSALANLFLNLAIFVPATLIIKGTMALIVCLIAGKEFSFLRMLIAFIVASIFMLGGYLAYETLIMGQVFAIFSFLFGIFQPAFCIPVAIIAISIMRKNSYMQSVKQNLKSNSL